MRILIVEDEESLAELVASRLKKEKYIINIAGLYNRGYKVKGVSGETSTIQSENIVYCLCLSDEGI